MKTRLVMALLICALLGVFLVSCAPADRSTLRPIMVSNVSVEIGVGSPIPVDIFVSGEWPDLCAQLAQSRLSRNGTEIELTLLATPIDPDCPPDQLGLPFRIAYPLNAVELPQGNYTITVNGVSAPFEWVVVK